MTTPIKLAAALLLATASVEACTIPVFRYALDRWRPDLFGLTAEKDWKQGKAGRKAAKAIDSEGTNLAWRDVEDEASGVSLFWPRSEQELWSGKAKPATVTAMVSSPAREKLAKQILAGDSAVWFLVECGDQARDKAFAARLEKRLDYLETVAAIPPQDPHDPDSRLGPGPELKIGFSMIRVKRNDPKEKFLVKMLAGPQGEDLLEGKGPFAAPVFARGRVLGAWTADDLDDEGIDEVSLFLLGACSCRVKAMNPGWDLLMPVDWDSKLMDVELARHEEEQDLPDLPPLDDEPAPEPVETKKPDPAPETDE